MKTITTQKIDGFDIITNIYSADGLIDPEATKKVVAVEIGNTDEWGAIKEVNSQMQVYANQAAQAKRNSKDAKTMPEKTKFWNEYLARYNQVSDLRENLIPLAKNMKKKIKELTLEHAVYFNPKPGDLIVDDLEAENISQAMISATQSGKVIDKDLNKIDDYRGRKYWKKASGKWQGTDIIGLGVVPASGAIETKNLTPDQLAQIGIQVEKDRIAGLSSAKKLAEMQSMITGLVSRAAMMKVELDIKDDPDSLEKAQDWMTAETEAINAKYA